jgi:hypothetical protein
MLFQASRAVTSSSEMSRFISVSEYAPPSSSLLIPACIETLGANSGANQLPRVLAHLLWLKTCGAKPGPFAMQAAAIGGQGEPA